MKRSKVLHDLITSATSAKAHFQIWWAQSSEAKPQYVCVMQDHSDFFLASADAHYTAFFVYFAHLYDKRPDSSSIPTYLKEIESSGEPANHRQLQAEFESLARRAAPLITARHKTVAHVDAKLSEKDVFGPLNATWNDVRSVINDTATFVAKLAGTSDLGSIGICDDRRLVNATMQLIRALPREA